MEPNVALSTAPTAMLDVAEMFAIDLPLRCEKINMHVSDQMGFGKGVYSKPIAHSAKSADTIGEAHNRVGLRGNSTELRFGHSDCQL